METLSYNIQINARPEKVWTVLWGEITYQQWTSAFAEGSFYEGDLKEGNIVKFLKSDNTGMYSRVEKVIPNQEIRFLHLGEIYDGVETPQKWEEATESFILEETENETLLKSKIKISPESKDFYEEHFPKALGIIKNLSENQL